MSHPRRPRDGSFLSCLRRFTGASGVAGIVVAALLVPLVGGLGLGAKITLAEADSLPPALLSPQMSQASTVYDADGGVIATVFDRDRTVVASDRINPLMKAALVDIEDNRFYQHGAIDPKGILRAAGENLIKGGVAEGASTLTQQYVKNVFVDQAGDDQSAVRAAQAQTIARKLLELKYATKVEQTLTKDQILTNYLNITFFGEQAYGIESAAQRYFSTHAADLTLPQAALLAGLVQSPTRYDPIINPDNAKERRDTVLDKMAQYGTVTQAQADQAKNTPVQLDVTKPKQGCITAQGGEGFFCDYVRHEVLSDPSFGANSTDRAALWKRGGLQIHTTLEPDAQAALQKSLAGHVYASDKAAASMTVVRPGTGEIVAMGQSRPYGTGKDQTQINLNVDKAMGGGLGFQPGSTFKPFAAAAALDKGIPPSRSYPSPYSMTWPAMKDCAGHRYPASGQVHNDSTSLVGPFTMAPALAESVNTYFASLEADTGLCQVATMAGKLGLTHRANGDKLSVVPSMVLGANEQSPVTMAAAYAAFAAHGTYCTPTAISSVTTGDGKKLQLATNRCTRAMSSQTADTISTMLKGVVDDGTGSKAGLSDRPSAGKTGTTNDDKQVWFVGYTPELVGAVAISNTDQLRTLDGQSIGGKRVGMASGGGLAGPIWRDTFTAALKGTPVTQLPSVQLN
ncbi:transglycosylase domain-containing protein [Kitasatospora sp. NPDC101176]|uniref:transglycosylase domain-containing protein n=1 Tax=Kitasatospora sp. NPDC101176 TaxID=3364099 RepID=UPI00381D0314